MGLRDAVRNAVVFAKTTVGEPFVPPPGPPWEDVDLTTTIQWGLVLPGGAVMWDVWGDARFDNPLDRLHMVSRLQKTADEVGFSQEEFLERYNWVTRTKISAEAYENGTSYAINAPEVSEQKEES